VAVLRTGVVGRIRSCEAGQAWCEMQVGGYRGWLKRDEFFGAQPGEVIK
jgi:SH3-like domain-containing protein